MPSTEAQKRARMKYDAEKMSTISCRVSRTKADRFRKACEQLGTTQYAVLKEAVEAAIEKAEKKNPGI